MDRWRSKTAPAKRKDGEDERCRKSEEEKLQARDKVGESRNTVFFRGSGGSKSRLAKAAGVEPAGQMKDELHADVERSRFGSQNVQNSSASEHF